MSARVKLLILVILSVAMAGRVQQVAAIETFTTPASELAEEATPEPTARLDIQAVGSTVTLHNVARLPFSSTLERMHWLPESVQDQSIMVHFPVTWFANTPCKIRVTPTGSGRIGVWLRAPWSDAALPSAASKITYSQPRVTGAKILTSLKTSPTDTTHDQAIYFEILAADQQTFEISFQAKSKNSANITNPYVTSLPASPLPTSSNPIRRSLKGADRFRRGINLAAWLEVPKGADWGQPVSSAELQIIRSEGFDHVRLPVNFNENCGSAPEYKVSSELLSRVEKLLNQAAALNLAVVLNDCNHDNLMLDPTAHTPKMIQIWRQLAAKFRHHDAFIAYELVNEPSERLSGDALNRFNQVLVKAIRQIDPIRPIMISPSNYAKVEALATLRPVRDDNVIVQIHLYEPMPISHTQANWLPQYRFIHGLRFPGPPASPIVIPAFTDNETKYFLEAYNTLPTAWNPASEFEIQYRLQLAAAWSSANQIPIYLGEFGAVTQLDAQSRERYLACVRKTAESFDIGWAMWDWKSTFAYYRSSDNKVIPEIRNALFGN